MDEESKKKKIRGTRERNRTFGSSSRKKHGGPVNSFGTNWDGTMGAGGQVRGAVETLLHKRNTVEDC